MSPIVLLPLACVHCDPDVRAAILDQRFTYRLLTIGLPLILGGMLAAAVVYAIVARGERGQPLRLAPVALAGTFIGLGIGGLLDGIVLHQLLQVHQMISSELPPVTLIAKAANMFWDGIFHVGALVLTALGLACTWRLVGRMDLLLSGGALLWTALLGWGVFNTLDSVANHYVFRYHNVVEASANPMAWNAGFLLLGLAQVAAGWVGMRHSERRKRHASAPC